MSHLGLPIAIFEKMALVILILKAFSIFYWWLVIVFTILMILIFLIIGYLDVRLGIYEKENSINNQYNPELMSIYKK